LSNLDIYGTYKFVDRKVILRIRDRICETPEELLSSVLFREVITRFVRSLKRRDSPLLALFAKGDCDEITDQDIDDLVATFHLLARIPGAWVEKLGETSPRYVRNPLLLYDFVEGLYDYWREFERFIVCDSEGDRLDRQPYRTFNRTIESLTHLVRSVYRDVQENISNRHPTIYRQVAAGAEVAAIALPKPVLYPAGYCNRLDGIAVIRQVLMYPPLLLNPPMNKRSGQFQRTNINPLERLDIDPAEWLCYPAKVGPLLILVYFHEKFFELGFSLCNLFELAEDEFLAHKADAIYLFGVPESCLQGAPSSTVFYEDPHNGLLVAAVPARDEFGYFGYLKKMTLTLHNIAMMKCERMPVHGAMVRFNLKAGRAATILILGDTATGKSETLEAFRALGEEQIRHMDVIADDMGSLEIREDGSLVGYGTEVGAFVRLDDLHPGYAFGHLDRTIIMNPAQVNSRVVLPVTTYETIIQGWPVDFVLYANNYQEVDADHPIIERLATPQEALEVFREGISMSKGTTTESGLVRTYFTNIFGPVQFPELHEKIAVRYFHHFYSQGIFVGQLRTRLGLPGWERRGPQEAAQALMEMLQSS